MREIDFLNPIRYVPLKNSKMKFYKGHKRGFPKELKRKRNIILKIIPSLKL